jgi:hypothetical protein
MYEKHNKNILFIKFILIFKNMIYEMYSVDVV